MKFHFNLFNVAMGFFNILKEVTFLRLRLGPKTIFRIGAIYYLSGQRVAHIL